MSRESSNPSRAKLSAEARLAKRIAERVSKPSEESFAQPAIPPTEEYQAYKVKPAIDPVNWEEVPDPDDPNFQYSRKEAPYNSFAPHRLRNELRRRARVAEEAKALNGLKEGTPEWIEAKLIIESKHNAKAIYRIRALEILARAKKMFTDVLELRGGLTKEEQLAAAQEAVTNFLKMQPEVLTLETPRDFTVKKQDDRQDMR